MWVLRERHAALSQVSIPGHNPASLSPADQRALASKSLGLAIRDEFVLDFSFTHLNHGSFGTAP